MAHPAPIRTANATLVCPIEARLGRVHWTRADYIAQGMRQWHDVPAAMRPASQERFAEAFADVAMPVRKQQAEAAALKAARDAEFGAAA